MKRPIFYLLFCLTAVRAFALEWTTKERAVKAAPLQKTAETIFEFTNTGTKTVTILGVDTRCDCTEAAPSAQTFAPGASGRITARFHLGDRQGEFDRMITVTTDEGSE